MTSHQWIAKLNDAAHTISKQENLKLKSIEFTKLKGKQGFCTSSGDIKIQLHTSRIMKSEARQFHDIRTLAHELAHLRYFNHYEEFWIYQRELCDKLSSLLGIKVSGSYSIAGNYN